MEVVLDGEKDKESVGSEINPCSIIVDTSLEAIEKKKKLFVTCLLVVRLSEFN